MIIGLTGGIGSGKTLAGEIVAPGVRAVIDADELSRDLQKPGAEGYKRIREEFGADFFFPDGGLDRVALGQYVFAEPERLRRLNAVMHPLVLRSIIEKTADCPPEEITVVAVPLLFEAGWQDIFDAVWLVISDENLRKERVMRRNPLLSESEIGERIAAQMSDEKKLELFNKEYKLLEHSAMNRVLYNNGTPEEFAAKVRAALEDLKIYVRKQ